MAGYIGKRNGQEIMVGVMEQLKTRGGWAVKEAGDIRHEELTK